MCSDSPPSSRRPGRGVQRLTDCWRHCALTHCRAARAGLQSLFIAGGIHAEEIGLFATGGDSGVTPAAGSTWDDAALARLWEQHGVTPNYVMDFLK